MSTRKDGCKQLLDDLVLTHDHFLQFLLHQLTMLAEFLQDITQVALFSRHRIMFPEKQAVQSEGSVAIVTLSISTTAPYGPGPSNPRFYSPPRTSAIETIRVVLESEQPYIG